MKRARGIFITFEGPEGSGKSTLIRVALKQLKRSGRRVVLLREPGGTLIGEGIRAVLLDRKNKRMTVEAELLLYLAARAQIVREKILPELRKGSIVICDRYHDSTVAYQGHAGGLPLEFIRHAGCFAKEGLEPDFTFLLDVKAEVGLRRAGRSDRMEAKSLIFHKLVRKGFLKIAKADKKRVILIPDQERLEDKINFFKKILHDRVLNPS